MTGAGKTDATTPARPRIVCVVCFLNEAAHLPTFLASMVAQSRFPDLLLLVDDGSSDASPELAAALAAQRGDVRALSRPPRPPARDRLAEAAELRAFQWAVEQIDAPWDIVVKMDADLKLSSDLFETVERAFQQQPTLGVTGTYLSVLDERTGRLRRERSPAHHVRGPAKFYRRACFEQILPLPAILGWDTIDEITARMHGWDAVPLACPGGETVHLRPTGQADGRLRAQHRWGVCAYGIGQHPLWVLLSAARRVGDRPRLLGALAFLTGWTSAAVRRLDLRAAPEVRAYCRAEELARLRAHARWLVRRRPTPAL
jgi:poly-beta-1,6-N-acetyl-D-glucosamine synthase